MTRLSIAVVVAALALSDGTHGARAQYYQPNSASTSGNIEGFTVTGKGTVAAKPNRLEIDLEVSAASELTADAIVKYRDTKKRIQEAFVALKLENVSVEERGLLVDQKGEQMNRYFFGGEPNKRAKVEVQLTRKLVVKCKDIGKMDEETLLQLVARLLDVAQDAGAKIGASNDYNPYFYYDRFNNQDGLVKFILDDFDKLEEEAYGKAITDAEARAGRLAKLSRVKLGPVSAVREISSPSDREVARNDEMPQKRLEVSRFQEIPVKVELVVRFDTVPPPAAAHGRVGDR